MSIHRLSRLSHLATAGRRFGLAAAIVATAVGVSTTGTATAAAATLSASSASAAAPGWIQDDMNRAMQVASSSGRYLLIDFTGSDWCGWCIKLDNEVFKHPHFKTEAGRDFVFASLDFPRRTPQSDAIKRANREWQQRLKVRGFPTVFLADAQGRPFAKTGYRAGGPVKYVEHLRELVGLRRQQEQLVASGMKAEGLDRARMLGQALAVPQIMTPEKPEILAAILAADPEDSLGLVARHGSGVTIPPPSGETNGEKPKTPLQRELATISAMIEAGDTDDAARALRRVQQRFRPKGAELAEWSLVRIDFLAAVGKPDVAVSQADRVMRTRGVPKASIQLLGRRKAEMLLAAGKGAAAIAAWDAAIKEIDSDVAKEMAEGRDAFAARCRTAGG